MVIVHRCHQRSEILVPSVDERNPCHRSQSGEDGDNPVSSSECDGSTPSNFLSRKLLGVVSLSVGGGKEPATEFLDGESDSSKAFGQATCRDDTELLPVASPKHIPRCVTKRTEFVGNTCVPVWQKVRPQMYTLCFSVVWTALTAVGVIYLWQEPDFAQQSLLFRIIFCAMPFAGLPFVWGSIRKLRRFRNVRRVEVSGVPEYVWTELDGSEKRSTTDPRPAWEKDDRNFAD